MSEDQKPALGGGVSTRFKKKEPQLPPEAKLETTVPIPDLPGGIPENMLPFISAVVAAAVKQANANSESMLAKAMDKLGEALLESRKPYVDPAQAENDKKMRQSMKEQRERQIEQMKASQKWCKHLQGSNALSRLPGQLTAIAKHKLDTGEIIGLCLNCGKVWRAGDSDYMEQLSRASGCEMSMAGNRTFLDPTKVMKDGGAHIEMPQR